MNNLLKYNYQVLLLSNLNSLCIPFISYRTMKTAMLSNSKHFKEIVLSNLEKQHIAKSTLALCETLSKPTVVKAIAVNDINQASQEIHSYINDTQGTIQLRTTLFSITGEHYFNLSKMLSHYNNAKLVASSNEIKVPIRSLAELYTAQQFLTRFSSYIESLNCTGDSIRFNTKKNPFQDLEAFFYKTEDCHNNVRTFDIKMGNLSKGEFFKGEIRQYAMCDNEILWYPNKPTDLKKFHYEGLTSRLKSKTFLDEARSSMSDPEFEKFTSLAYKPYEKLQEDYNPIEIEEILMQIQILSTFPKAFNFINIYTIPVKIWDQKQMHFIDELSKIVNPSILNNPRNMQQYMLKAFRIYCSTNDPHVFKTMKPLKESQLWLSTELDKIGIDIFT